MTYKQITDNFISQLNSNPKVPLKYKRKISLLIGEISDILEDMASQVLDIPLDKKQLESLIGAFEIYIKHNKFDDYIDDCEKKIKRLKNSKTESCFSCGRLYRDYPDEWVSGCSYCGRTYLD